MTEAESREVDTILTVLSAYHRPLVKAALKRRNAHLRGERIANGWRIYSGFGEPPADAGDRMKLNNLWYTRERPMPDAGRSETATAPPKNSNGGSKTDLSMKPTDRKCPTCGEVMAWEPICPGCTLGRMGFRGRYVCMDDFDHTFYVTKPGVELPNR